MTDNTTTKAKDTLALPASSAASSAEPGSFLEKGPIEAERGSESNEAPPAEEQGYRQQFSKISWVLMCANLFTSSFLYGLDNTIVADIQGHIIEDFGDIEKLGWLGIGFPLGSVATILSIGRAYGLFDNKWVYIVSLIMFEAGSALCGGAPNMDAMIIGRVWAGVGGAGIYLGSLNIFTNTTTIKERSLYLASVGVTYSIGCVLGPVIGGAFVDSSAGWRWAFYINLLIFAALAPTCILCFKSINPQPNRTFGKKLMTMDWVGVTLNTAVYVLFVTAFTFGGATWAWSSGGTIALIVLFAITLVAYAVQQCLSLFTTPENRLFPVDFLKSRSMWLLHIGTACASTTFFIPLYYLPLYYQFVHGESGTDSAVRLLPLICICVFAFMLNGALLPVFGYYMPWYVVAAVFQLIAGAVMYTCVDVNTSNAMIYGFSVLLAMGGGLAGQSSYSIASSKVDLSRAADAVGFINVAQIGGVMIALTVTSSVFQNVGFSKLQHALSGRGYSSQEIRAALGGQRSGILLSASPEVKKLALDAIVETIGTGYILIIAAGALALVCSLLMKREKLNLTMQAVG